LALLDVEGFPLRRRWYAVHRSGRRLTNAGQAFLDYLIDESEREVALPGAGLPETVARGDSPKRDPLHMISRKTRQPRRYHTNRR
jgi:hypothetical protein